MLPITFIKIEKNAILIMTANSKVDKIKQFHSIRLQLIC